MPHASSSIHAMFETRLLRRIDYTLMIMTFILIILGIIVIYSVTSHQADKLYNDQFYFLKKQLMWFIIGIFFFLFFIYIDYNSLANLTVWLYSGSILLLLITMFLGQEVLGAKRWIDLGFFSIQPSEFTKIVLIIVLSNFLCKIKENITQFRNFIFTLVIIILPVFLIFIQPDLGTSIIIFLIWLSMVYFGGCKLKHIIFLTGISLAITPLLWQFLKDYQKRRLLVFLDPNVDPSGAGYQLIQSKIALGSGGVFGKGFFQSEQAHLNFIPGIHTDFIFSSIGEQFGLIGCAILLILYLIILLRALEKAYIAKDLFGYSLSIGITVMLFVHIFINIGMTIGIVPITGIPLPFLSYGGSSLVVNMIAIALLLNIGIRRQKIRF